MSHWSSNDGGRGAAEPPQAPPLPPQPSSAQVAAIALARFAQNINYGGSAATATPYRLRKSPAAGGLIVQERSSPAPSGDVAHKTGIAISSLDISPCRTRAVLAGRDILKTVAVTGSSCTEDYNLRERSVRYAATHGTAAGTAPAKYKDHLAANDVKWSHGDFHTTIATAAANGQIVVYDLNRAGVELARLHEHNRQVHRLGFNPHRGNLLLSGSQDATTRLWDLRALAGERSVMTCHSKSKYAGNNEGVRDLRWSPTNGVEFAIGTDNGVLQRWDIRKENSPTLKVKAHEKTCNSIDWHPDGKHLVSGSSDKRAKVWDFSSSDRRMKPLWQLRVPQAAVHVRWRPAGWSSEDQRSGHWDCTQLAVSYDKEDPRIHIWDLRRPCIPFRVISRYEIPATAILWHSEDLLWSVDSDGVFTQNDVRFAPVTIDQYNVNPIDIAPTGQMLFATMKREKRRLSIEDVTDNLLNIERRDTSKAGRASAGQSSTPGSHEEPSLLNSSLKHRRSKAPNSLKSPRPMDTTPPSGGPSGGPGDAVRPLDQSLQPRHMYQNKQIMALGRAPGLVDTDGFKFLARHYLAPPDVNVGDGSCNLHLVVGKTFMYNAGVAASAGKHRLAQTWRILAHAVEKELGNRAEQNYQRRMVAAASREAKGQSSNMSVRPVAGDPTEINKDLDSQMTQSASDNATAPHSKTHSELSTPLARPTKESVADVEAIDSVAVLNQYPEDPLLNSAKGKQTEKLTTEALDPANTDESDQKQHMNENKLFQLDNALASHVEEAHTKTMKRSPSRESSPDTDLIELDRQIAERRAAMGNYRPHQRSVFKLDDPFADLLKSPMGLSEHAEALHHPNTFHNAKETFASEDSHKKGQAESAMDFDDEIEMTATQHSPNFPQSSVNSHKAKPQVSSGPATKGMIPSCEGDEDYHPAIINHGDWHPLDIVPPPPQNIHLTSNHKYVKSDFLVTKHNVDNAPYIAPWTASAMFIPLIEYHCQALYDAQLPAYLILHLMPYLDVPMNHYRALGIIGTYYDHLMNRFELFVEAAELRNYCKDDYEEIANWGSEGIATGGPWCTNCKKASKGRQRKYCERCQQPWAPCAICHDLGAPVDSIWAWCVRCGHGGHRGCLRSFWEFSEEGACPALGCTCDCAPGRRREEKQAAWEAEGKKHQQLLLHGGRVAQGGARSSLLQGGRSASGGKKSVRIVLPGGNAE